jgi:hypothetical protein
MWLLCSKMTSSARGTRLVVSGGVLGPRLVVAAAQEQHGHREVAQALGGVIVLWVPVIVNSFSPDMRSWIAGLPSANSRVSVSGHGSSRHRCRRLNPMVAASYSGESVVPAASCRSSTARTSAGRAAQGRGAGGGAGDAQARIGQDQAGYPIRRRPISAFRIAERLRQLGIRSAQSRSTALFQLATELPAALLARMLGVHIMVAVAGDAPAPATGPPTRPRSPAAPTQEDRHSDSWNIRLRQRDAATRCWRRWTAGSWRGCSPRRPSGAAAG